MLHRILWNVFKCKRNFRIFTLPRMRTNSFRNELFNPVPIINMNWPRILSKRTSQEQHQNHSFYKQQVEFLNRVNAYRIYTTSIHQPIFMLRVDWFHKWSTISYQSNSATMHKLLHLSLHWFPINSQRKHKIMWNDCEYYVAYAQFKY